MVSQEPELLEVSLVTWKPPTIPHPAVLMHQKPQRCRDHALGHRYLTQEANVHVLALPMMVLYDPPMSNVVGTS